MRDAESLMQIDVRNVGPVIAGGLLASILGGAVVCAAAGGLLGALIGLVAGVAISLVLVHVVNRQSFHWSLEVHWPFAALAALIAAIVALCGFGARVSAALAVRSEAVLAVKDDA